MQIIYSAHCEIMTRGFVLRRTFYFPMKEMRDAFMANPPENTTIRGYGADHLMTHEEAARECEKDAGESL